MMNSLQRAVISPQVEIIVERALRRQVLGHIAPLAPRANFLETSLIKEDLTKDDNIKVTKAHVAVISQLFGIGLSKEVVKKVLTSKGLREEQLKGILGEFNPAQDLTGSYLCFKKCQDYNALASIEQYDTIFSITNEVGKKSVGIYETPNQFLVTMPGNVRAFVLDDKITINWVNGSVWKRQ